MSKSQELLERARAKQAAILSEIKPRSAAPGSPPAPGLEAYDYEGDKFTQRRYRSFAFQVLLPICVFLLAGWYFLVGQYQKPAAGSAAVGAAAPSAAKTVSVVNSVMSVGGPLQGAAPSAASARGPEVVTVRCYAVRDSLPVITGTVVLESGLFLPSRFTRVNGGLLFNEKFGWHKSSDFGCGSDLSSIEVEYVVQGVPSPVPTRSVRVVSPKPIAAAVASVVPSATPTVAASPTPTLTIAKGLSQFAVSGCDVSWLAWDVYQVFLDYDGRHVGVPGDNAGGPVIYSVCPYSGPITLTVWSKLGSPTVRTGHTLAGGSGGGSP